MDALLSFLLQERVSALNDAPAREAGEFVLLWLQGQRRIRHNLAFAHAQRRANELARPLVVYEGLRRNYPYASERLHHFVLGGAGDNARDCAEHGVAYGFFLETPGSPRGVLHQLAARASVVVTDYLPTFIHPAQTRALAARAQCRVEVVDAAGVAPLSIAPKAEIGARTLRPKIMRRLAELHGLARKHVRGTLDQRDFATEATHRLCHLDTNRSAAQHEQSAWDGLHASDLAVAPDALEPAQTGHRRHDWIGSRREDDVLRRVAYAVDFDDAYPGKPAGAADQRDAVVCEPALLAGVGVVRHHEVAPGERCLDVHLGARRCIECGTNRLARSKQGLGRDARPIGALTSDELALDQRDAQATIGQRSRAVLTGRAGAYDDYVVVAAHVGSSSPPCSRTMNSAYQSGQFGSASPVRFSCSPCAAAARRSALPRSPTERNVVSRSTRPGSRAVISWSSQRLPSGSPNEANDP